jgi:nitroreductase
MMMNLESTLSIEHEQGAKQGDLDLLLNRASAIKLTEPGPNATQIDCMLRAAVTAPDHGRIRPWRFVVMTGDGRKQLGELLAKSKKASSPDTSDEELEKIRGKPLRAPLVIVLACEPNFENYKVPVVEQQLAVGAAGTHLMLAAKALGFGSNWKTGSAAHDPVIISGLGFSDAASIIGFFYIGTEPKGSPLARATIAEVVTYRAG